MKLSVRQTVVVALILASIAPIALMRAIPSMSLVLFLIAFCAVLAALVLEIAEYSAARKQRSKP